MSTSTSHPIFAESKPRHAVVQVLFSLLALVVIAAACSSSDAEESVSTNGGDGPTDVDPTQPADAAGDDVTNTDDGEPVVPDGDNTVPPAAEAPLGAGPYPIADVTIEYSHATNGVEATYRISCLGDTATVSGDSRGVTDQAACSALADRGVQDRLIEGLPTDVACTEQYGGDDYVVITGRINDVEINTTAGRQNGCAIDDWDRTLANIVPKPIGA